jgi:hypothetical protein
MQVQQDKAKPKNACFIPRGSVMPVDNGHKTAPFPQLFEVFCTTFGAFALY